MPNKLFDPELVIARLLTAGTPFNYVRGAVDFAHAREDLKSRERLPAAYVAPLTDRPAASEANIVHQNVTSTFGVMIAVSNLRDTRGQNAGVDLRTARLWVLDTLLGWMPETGYWPCEMGPGRLMTLDDAVLWWQDDYATALQVRQQI